MSIYPSGFIDLGSGRKVRIDLTKSQYQDDNGQLILPNPHLLPSRFSEEAKGRVLDCSEKPLFHDCFQFRKCTKATINELVYPIHIPIYLVWKQSFQRRYPEIYTALEGNVDKIPGPNLWLTLGLNLGELLNVACWKEIDPKDEWLQCAKPFKVKEAAGEFTMENLIQLRLCQSTEQNFEIPKIRINGWENEYSDYPGYYIQQRRDIIRDIQGIQWEDVWAAQAEVLCQWVKDLGWKLDHTDKSIDEWIDRFTVLGERRMTLGGTMEDLYYYTGEFARGV